MKAFPHEVLRRAGLNVKRDKFAVDDKAAGDFLRLRADPGIAILRTAAETAISDLFDGRRPKVELSDGEAQELLNLFMASKPHPSAETRNLALGDQLGLISGAFDELGDLEILILKQCASADPDLSIWRRFFRRWRTACDWNGKGPVNAELIGRVVAHAAFGDNRIDRVGVTRLRKYLKRLILMPPGQALFEFRLSYPFHWCLLAIAIEPRANSNGGSIQQVVHKVVCSEAEQAVSNSRWAGFWEQWCLNLALADKPPKEAADLVRLVRNLPLIRGAEAIARTGQLDACLETTEDDAEQSGAENMTYLDWVANAPPFATRLLIGSL